MHFPEQLSQSSAVSCKGEEPEDVKDVPAVFNKRLFAAQGSVTITPKAKCIMGKNENLLHDFNLEFHLPKFELQAMRSVVDGLKLIHKGHDYAKDVLCHVITMETYGPNEYVCKKSWEETLSCYYIVCGAVEVRYDVKGTHSRNVYQSDIVYNHGTGEYLGIVSLEGQEEDIAPPSSVYTKEPTQFLRIDRTKFHEMIKTISAKIQTDMMKFLSDSKSIFKSMPEEAKEKILPKLEVQEYRPNRVILAQGQRSNFLYFVISGRCRCNRKVYIAEAGKEVLFYLCCKEKGEFFGEESILDDDVSYNTVTSMTNVVCYRLHKSAFEIVKGGLLTQIVEQHRDDILTEEELQIRGYKNSIWNYYKHTKVKEPLREKGHLKFLTRKKAPRLSDRPPTALEQYTENMLRFKEKGYAYEPVRVRTATYRRPTSTVSTRTRSARPRTTSPRMYNIRDQLYDSDQDTAVTEADDEKENSNKVISDELAKTLEKHADDLEGDEGVSKLLTENEELARYFQNSLDGAKTSSIDKENFMKNSVLATMKSEDIVRKAMAMADKKAENTKISNKTDEEEWSTVLHAENRQAKFLISINKMKVSVLRKQLDDIEKKRIKTAGKKKQLKTMITGQNHLRDVFNTDIETRNISEPDIDSRDSKYFRHTDDHTTRESEHSVINETGDHTTRVSEHRVINDTGEHTTRVSEHSVTNDRGDHLTRVSEHSVTNDTGIPSYEGIIDNSEDDERTIDSEQDLKINIEDDSDAFIQKIDTKLRPVDDISISLNTNLKRKDERLVSARF